MRKLFYSLALLWVPLTALQAATPTARKPNILYILADDLGYGDVQPLNPQRGKIKTPHLDKLAAQGMAFTDAHSGSSVCTPTRYGLLTGRYAWRSRLQRGVLDGGNDEPLIAAERLTVPGFLKQHGYATACIGKWHLGFIATAPADADAKKGKGNKGGGAASVGSVITGGPTTRGFDYYLGCSNARTMASLIENDRVIERIEPVAMLPRLAQRATAYLGERAAAAKAGKPFFLYLPLTSPHTPIVPTPEWQGKSGLGDYADFVMQTDAMVGEVLSALDRLGLAGNTLVIFTSDNGCSPAAGTDKLERQGHFASAQFRGYKADIWNGGHRVPFLVRWPDKVKAGSRSAQVICHTDLLATCAELMGAKLSASTAEDSVSILPALMGRDTAPLREAVVHHSIHGMFSIRQGPWKLALCAGSGGWSKGGGPESPQLYDMAADVGETKNLASQKPEFVARLRKLLESYVANGRSTPGASQTNDAKIELHKPAGKASKE